MGKVYLIGAGPGDPGLLTVRAKQIIETADVVIYDYLANKAFLDMARPEAEVVYVGKMGGNHTMGQEDINQLIVDKALSGKTVARLKGGDPFVFGRGGEEAEELVAAGVDWEVIPGVTSGVAAPAYAGIPVTHRAHTTSVCFITGHEDPTKEATGHDWEVYARATSTLVFYMGVKNLPMITERLIAGGRPSDTPCALVMWGTHCNQRSFTSTLDKVAAEAKALGYKAPSIFIVGGVCSLKSTLDWYERRPLLGKGVVVTRSRHQASALSDRLAGLGACVFEYPTIEVVPVDDDEPLEQAILGLPGYDWVVFTSTNGVECFFNKLNVIGLDARALGGLEVAAIGPATAEELLKRGIRADFVPDKYVAEHVLAGLLERGVAGKRVLIPRALAAREVLPEELQKAGAEVTVLPVYETRLAKADPFELLDALEGGRIHYVTFASSSTVDNFFESVGPQQLERMRGAVRFACIGPVTAKTLEKYGFTADVQPEDYTIPALVDALVADAEKDAEKDAAKNAEAGAAKTEG